MAAAALLVALAVLTPGVSGEAGAGFPPAPSSQMPSGCTTQVPFAEPTSSLSQVEADQLYALMGRLQQRGVTCIFVSHRMPEIFRLCESTGGTQWYIVEQESYAYPPLECVDRCLQNLRQMGK